MQQLYITGYVYVCIRKISWLTYIDCIIGHETIYTLLEKFWRISLCLTDDAIAKLYVT